MLKGVNIKDQVKKKQVWWNGKLNKEARQRNTDGNCTLTEEVTYGKCKNERRKAR